LAQHLGMSGSLLLFFFFFFFEVCGCVCTCTVWAHSLCLVFWFILQSAKALAWLQDATEGAASPHVKEINGDICVLLSSRKWVATRWGSGCSFVATACVVVGSSVLCQETALVVVKLHLVVSELGQEHNNDKHQEHAEG